MYVSLLRGQLLIVPSRNLQNRVAVCVQLRIAPLARRRSWGDPGAYAAQGETFPQYSPSPAQPNHSLSKYVTSRSSFGW